jgi:hypothetical protein
LNRFAMKSLPSIAPGATLIFFVAAGAFFAGWGLRSGGEASPESPDKKAPGFVAVTAKSSGKGSQCKLRAAAAKDSRGAWEEALTLEEGAWRDLEVARAWRWLAENDPARAWGESFRLTDGAELRATLVPDPDKAAAWVAATPEEHRGNATIEMASLLLKRSPEEALAWAGAVADPELRRDVQLGLATQWTQSDPAAAAAWCLSSKEGGDCLPAVISTWAASDLMGASEWLAARPADAGRDAAALRLIEPLLELDPPSAQSWAKSLTDANLRRFTEARIAAIEEAESGVVQ